MKQINYLFFIIIIFSYLSCTGVQQLNKELNNLTGSLQKLANALQQAQPDYLPPLPPRDTTEEETSAPTLTKYYNYIYNNQGDSIEFAIRLVGVPFDREGQKAAYAYDLYLYGPQIKNPSAQTFNEIIESINPAGYAASYPMVNTDKKSYLLVNGTQFANQEIEKKRFEDIFLPTWQGLKDYIENLMEKQYNTTNNKILDTTEKHDKEYVGKLQILSDQINLLIKDNYTKINNLDLLDNIKQNIERLVQLIANTQGFINEFYTKNLKPDAPTSLILTFDQQEKKFGEELSPIIKKGPKISLYKNLLDMLDQTTQNLNNTLDTINKAILNQKDIQLTPVNQYYKKALNRLQSGKSPAQIIQEEKEAQAKKRQSTVLERGQEYEEEHSTEETSEEWEDSDDDDDDNDK